MTAYSGEIIAFGSLNLDLVFNVQNLPRRGETVLCPNYLLVPGGKGANQAVAASLSGAVVYIIGCVGRDGFGDLLINSLKSAGVETSGVRRVEEPTGCAAIAVDREGANQIMVAGGANLKTQADEVPDKLLSRGNILLLQMEVEADENWKLIARAKENGVKVLLNVAPAAAVPEDSLKKIDVLIANESESLSVANLAGIDTDDPIRAVRQISKNYGIDCVVTLGAKGAFSCGPEGAWQVDALPIEPVDTTAAGDCFVGWLAGRLAAGNMIPDAIRWASTAAGITCMTTGAQTSLPDYDRVVKSLPIISTPNRK